MSRSLASVYAFGIALNGAALVYALSTGAFLYATAFVFVMLYLGFRYRMIASG